MSAKFAWANMLFNIYSAIINLLNQACLFSWNTFFHEVSMYASVYVCLCVCVCVCVYMLCVCVCMLCVCVWVGVCAYACVCVGGWVCVYVCVSTPKAITTFAKWTYTNH